MPDQPLPPVPEAKIVPKRRVRVSIVWVIPMVAAVVGIWIAATTISKKGPEITIVLTSAEGLEAKKTKVTYNGLVVGTINAIRLAPDHKRMLATAEISSMARDFLVKDTKFWVVKPRISGLNITGLGTLISGCYIGVQPGQSKESARAFTALESPPLTGDVPGRFFTLKTPELGSLSEGTPVYFRQLQAGQVVSYELDQGGKFLNVRIFVQSPYDQFVTADTRFWHASGIDVSLTANGLHIQTESVMSILAGGVAFETPATDATQPPAAADTTFALFDNHTDAFKPSAGDPHIYLLVFKQSIQGLSVGAAVELGGVTIGEVTQISPQLDEKTADLAVRVTACVDPERYGVKFIGAPAGGNTIANHRKVIDTLAARGMRAQLKPGNLLTGSLYVSMDFFPDEAPSPLDWSQNPVQLPTVSKPMDALEDRVNDLLKSLDQTAASARGTLTNVDGLAQNLTNTLAAARGTLTNADTLLGTANKLIEPNSPLETELNTLLLQGGDAARALRVLADYLERHPEALIRGKTKEAK